MMVSESGEARVNGYLFVLERSLKTFLPADVARDAVREIESHLRERIAAAEGAPNERDALERILAELGPPLRVAQAYSVERTLDEAVATGRLVPTLRALWYLAVSTTAGFGAALGVLIGYFMGVALLAMAAFKPIVPNNVGLWVDNASGVPVGLGIQFPMPAGAHLVGGYWILPACTVAGLGLIVGTSRGARRFLNWWRERRLPGVR